MRPYEKPGCSLTRALAKWATGPLWGVLGSSGWWWEKSKTLVPELQCGCCAPGGDRQRVDGVACRKLGLWPLWHWVALVYSGEGMGGPWLGSLGGVGEALLLRGVRHGAPAPGESLGSVQGRPRRARPGCLVKQSHACGLGDFCLPDWGGPGRAQVGTAALSGEAGPQGAPRVWHLVDGVIQGGGEGWRRRGHDGVVMLPAGGLLQLGDGGRPACCDCGEKHSSFREVWECCSASTGGTGIHPRFEKETNEYKVGPLHRSLAQVLHTYSCDTG